MSLLAQLGHFIAPRFLPVLWIRIGFTADPEPAFYLNADLDPAPGSQTNADPGLTFKSQKVEFLHEKYI
jgi:hypothetical protein